MPGVLSDTSSVCILPKSYLVVNRQYIARDYLITKAKMPTNSEAIGAISLFKSVPVPSYALSRRRRKRRVRGRPVPFCSLQPRGFAA